MGLFRRKKKQLRFCPNCRMPVAEGSAFCDACGLRVTPPPACKKCGIPLAPDTNFCESCGTPVGTAPAPDGNGETETASPKKDEPKKRRKSGKKAPKKDEFVHPAMLEAEQAGGKPGVLPESEPAGDAAAAKEPVAPPAVPEPESPAMPGASKKTLAIAGTAIICIILALALMTGFIHLPLPTVQQTADFPPVPVTDTRVPEPTNVVTGTPVVELTTGAPSLVPGPTQVPPESYLIWFQAERDPITNLVTVIYNGGKGQRAVRDVLVRLTRSDGEVLTQTFRPLVVGEGAELQGTKYDDRLEVIVTYNSGDRYTVIDKVFFYQQRN